MEPNPAPAVMTAMVNTSFGPPDVLHRIELPRPEPLPTEILVRVKAVGLNPIDWKTRAGAPTPAAAALGTPPHVLGWDVSGIVEAVGGGVHLFSPGDEVYGLPWFPRPARAYAEYVTAPSRHFALKPITIDHVHAAALPLAGLTAWQALTEVAHLKAGDRILIHAAGGGVGHLAVQIAHHLGAHVIASASAGKHDWLRALGADELIDYRNQKFEDATGDIDVVLDLVGDAIDHTSIRSLRTLVSGGTLLSVAPGTSERLPALAEAAGVHISPALLVEPDRPGLQALAALVEQGALEVAVERAFPLEEVAAAHRLGDEGHTAGKIVLTL
jgi:NADPH:quinone reductase-like Zn-dependent oxidoreductase